MSITQPIITEIAYRTWCINEFGMDTMFLLEGKEKALLIDTGTCLFDIPALLKTLTTKPVTVALTHGHMDHVGGISFFPQVYIHPDDIPILNLVNYEARAFYTRHMLPSCGKIYDFTWEQLMNGPYDTQLLPLSEGDTIDLGERLIHVYETPGHTPGGLSFLDTKERILFSGDACNRNILMVLGELGGGNHRPKSTISDLLATAEKLEGLHSQYDRHYNGHVSYGTHVHVLPLPECLIRDCISLCKDLLTGRVCGSRVASAGFMTEHFLAKNNGLQIRYLKEQVK